MGIIKEKINTYLLIFIGISFVSGQIIRIPFFGYGILYPHDIVIILWISIRIIFFSRKPSGYILKFFILFILSCIYSLLIQLNNYPLNELLYGSTYILRLGLYGLLYSLLSINDSKKLLISLFIGGGLFSFIGLIQLYLYPDLRNLSYMGLDPHYKRIFSSVFDPNIAGLIMLFTIIEGLRRYQLNMQRIFTVIVLMLSLISLFLTVSRSSILAAILTFGIFSLFRKLYKLFFVGICVFGCIFILLINPNQSYSILRKETAIARFGSWNDAYSIWRHSPITGVGFNMLRSVQESGFLYKDTNKIFRSSSGIDNSILFILVTAGIPGFIIFTLFYTSFFRLGFRSQNGIFLVLAAFSLFVHSLFINTIFYPWVFVWLLTLTKWTENTKGNIQ